MRIRKFVGCRDRDPSPDNHLTRDQNTVNCCRLVVIMCARVSFAPSLTHNIYTQLDWMLANGKLPPAMVVAADRMREAS